jgi:hypothetical protein
MVGIQLNLRHYPGQLPGGTEGNHENSQSGFKLDVHYNMKL